MLTFTFLWWEPGLYFTSFYFSRFFSVFVFFYRQAISNDERIKSGLDFLYDAPPGFNKGMS